MAFVSLGASNPSVEVAVDFTNDPTSSTRTWTDVTPYVREYDFSRGRDSPLEATRPGELRLTLDNRDRRFDPTYTSSPYYPGVLPMRRVRVRSQWASVTYDRFLGFVTDWPLSWPDDKDALVQVTAVDAFRVLSLHDLVGKSYASALTGTRMGTVLTDTGFLAAEQSLQAGQTTVVASGTLAADSFALDHLLDVSQTEMGVLFADGGGTIVYQDRHHRILNEATSAGTIGDSDGEIRYSAVRAPYGEASIWNQAKFTPSGGTTETSTDAGSTAKYYARTHTRSLLTASQTEALTGADYFVTHYKDPFLRVEEVTLEGARGTMWAAILPREISDNVLFRRRPPGGGTISQEEHIEGIRERGEIPNHVVVDWLLSPVDTQDYWIIDTSNLGTATTDTYNTTRLGH